MPDLDALNIGQRLIATVDADPTRTLELWDGLLDHYLDTDWSEVCSLAIQHRIEGLLVDAIKTADASDIVPPSVWSMLRHRARLAKARLDAILMKIEQVHAVESSFFDQLILYKGITMVGRYLRPDYRMVSDLDSVIREEYMADARQVLTEVGFIERHGFRGSSFYADPDSQQIGVDYVMFDLHLEPLPRFEHGSLRDTWQDAQQELFTLPDGTNANRFAPDEAALITLVYLAEHAASWIHACMEDDVRLIKVLDIEVLSATATINADRVKDLAVQRGVLGSALLGLSLVRTLRGSVPASLLPLLDGIEVGDLLDLVALPDGTLSHWTLPMLTRMFRTDRAAEALRMAPGGRHRLRDWHDPNGLLQTSRERVWAIGELAYDRCVGQF